MRRAPALVLLVLLAAALAATEGWRQYSRFLNTPLRTGSGSNVLLVERGASLHSLVAELERRGATRMDWRWRLLGRLQPVTIKAGEYALAPGLRPPQLLRLLASGKVVQHHFTIVEGWTVRQMLAALSTNDVLVHSVHGVGDLQGVAGLPDGNPEGWFLPETYVFVHGDSDVKLLRRAYRAMQRALADAWQGRAADLPYTGPYQLLTMASIIEKETSRGSERADIAGVFVRRLRQHWRLETDPTVIYGMGDAYSGNIRRQDLEKDTPYNTYTRRGLPPTPIALPGAASLQAAAHPAGGDAMFFVADGHGGHTFSRSLEEHNAAVQKMLRASRDAERSAANGHGDDRS
ncbi:MAG: endolytic transglycosylase MltG [Lysobacterales bacterium]